MTARHAIVAVVGFEREGDWPDASADAPPQQASWPKKPAPWPSPRGSANLGGCNERLRRRRLRPGPSQGQAPRIRGRTPGVAAGRSRQGAWCEGVCGETVSGSGGQPGNQGGRSRAPGDTARGSRRAAAGAGSSRTLARGPACSRAVWARPGRTSRTGGVALARRPEADSEPAAPGAGRPPASPGTASNRATSGGAAQGATHGVPFPSRRQRRPPPARVHRARAGATDRTQHLPARSGTTDRGPARRPRGSSSRSPGSAW